mmetsp:Transcript_34462/g.80439  ORF Transcript_34462/g.80439 Transcript_34462/m.80439 type:complete len:97 (-) Transcript_34462:60-350(-)
MMQLQAELWMQSCGKSRGLWLHVPVLRVETRQKKTPGRKRKVAPEDQPYKDTGVTRGQYKKALAYASSLVKPADGSPGIGHTAGSCGGVEAAGAAG